jgi:uncharacterized protein
LGKRWRQLHLLSIPALLLGTAHVVLTGSNYLGAWIRTPSHQGRSAILMALVIGILLLRIRSVWSIFSLEQAYASPQDLPLSNTKPDESSITTHAASSHDQG